MAHPNEKEFQKAVAAWLSESFEDIDHEYDATLPSGKRPDFIAHTPLETYVIEVESSGETRRLYEGVGQTLVYAEETGHVPVVVFPAHDPPDLDSVPEAVELVLV